MATTRTAAMCLPAQSHPTSYQQDVFLHIGLADFRRVVVRHLNDAPNAKLVDPVLLGGGPVAQLLGFETEGDLMVG